MTVAPDGGVSRDGCSQIGKGVELLKLTSRHNCQQAFDGALAMLAPGAS